MPTDKKVLIAGGGIAGASLAIRLARMDFDVTLIEKDRFPRHKLCGEFVSPECLRHFEELGVMDALNTAGGDTIRETRFFSESGNSVGVESEWFSEGARGALGISRAELDFRMLQRAKELGATVVEECRVTGVNFAGARLDLVKVKNARGETETYRAGMFVDATGRARVLGKLIEKQRSSGPAKKKIKHIAFKAHFENVKLTPGTCEIYFFRGGYGGLSYIERGAANHCFIVSSKVARRYKGDPDRLLEEVIFRNTRARAALEAAEKKFDWLAVAIENFGPQPANDIENLVSIGDAFAFIDPFTGSGMLMGLESSEILANVVSGSRAAGGIVDPVEIVNGFNARSVAATKRRLQICSAIHRLSFSPRLAGLIISAASFSPDLLQRFTSLTRPTQHPSTIR